MMETTDSCDEELPVTRRSYDPEALIVARFGSMTAIPSLAIEPTHVPMLHLDQATGFVLAQIDGATTVESLLDLTCVVPRVDVLRILGDLAARGVVSFRV
jgi:hypothetical protein